MKSTRRSFIRNAGLGSLTLVGTSALSITALAAIPESGTLSIKGWLKGKVYKPLDKITVSTSTNGRFKVYDGEGNVYISSTTDSMQFSFAIGGALGKHNIVLSGNDNMPIDVIRFNVNAVTELKDGSGNFSKLFEMTKTSLYGTFRPGSNIVPMFAVKWNDKMYKLVASWFQDNYYIFKGLKYFEKDVTGYLDFYGDSQSDQGMIFDHVEGILDYSSWKNRFPEGFVAKSEEQFPVNIVVRTPVENMGEYTYLEAVYFAWKATGDTSWMMIRLENALKALKFSQTSPYYWSDKFQLMKRGHTIDFWDYQPTEDAQIAGDDIMNVKLGQTRHSIMFGDNLRMAASCEYLSEMLIATGRETEAESVLVYGKGLRERIEKLSWNGSFFTHQTPEDPSVKRDFGGTDESKQVVLSNTYALNANISHEKCVAIIKTYQRIRTEMPSSSPGEWYLCYPPFEKGYGNNDKWEYMNGGVSPIAGGELSHGALNHGFEKYGVDILLRIKASAEKHQNVIDDTYKGLVTPKKTVNYQVLNIASVANAGFSGKPISGGIGWTNEDDNDFSAFPIGMQTFIDIPFVITDPSKNNGKACVILSMDKGYPMTAKLAIGKKTPYICILQCNAGSLMTGGLLTTIYKDGTKVHDYMTSEKIGNWWFPRDKNNWKVAWRGANAKSIDVGIGIYVMKNKFPDNEIEYLEFETVKNKSKWIIAGITLADNDPELSKTDLSYGIPNTWAAGAVAFALIEGLAGVKDTGLAFDKVRISPRWAASNEKEVSITAKYESSGGYISYRYRLEQDSLSIEFTGNALGTEVELLLPEGKKALSVKINGKNKELLTKTVEQSVYVLVNISRVGVNVIDLVLG
jgi:hypothetical protein